MRLRFDLDTWQCFIRASDAVGGEVSSKFCTRKGRKLQHFVQDFQWHDEPVGAIFAANSFSNVKLAYCCVSIWLMLIQHVSFMCARLYMQKHEEQLEDTVQFFLRLRLRCTVLCWCVCIYDMGLYFLACTSWCSGRKFDLIHTPESYPSKSRCKNNWC